MVAHRLRFTPRLPASPHAAEAALHDAVLVRRFNAGDSAAFVEIVSRHRERLLRLAQSLLRNRADSEDVTQDTFVRAHRGLAQFRGDSSLAAWLHRIAFNLSCNLYWHHIRRRRHTTRSLDANLGDHAGTTFADIVASPEPDPARATVNREFAARVARCMAQLGVQQQEILHCRNQRDQSYEEIAAELGIAVGTVKSRIARARKALRALLQKPYPQLQPGAQPMDCFEPVRSSDRLEVACG